MSQELSDLAIAATAHNRPDRLERLLASIAQATGCKRWPVFISIEPTSRLAEIQAVIERFKGRLSLRSRVNEARKGVRHNPFDNVEWVIAEAAQTVLLLEDDLMIDRQALRWCELLAASALQQPQVLCANLLMTTCNSESIFIPAAAERQQLADLVIATRFFSSYGMLFTRQQWIGHFRANWFVDTPLMENFEGRPAVGWDVAMNRLLLRSPGLQVLQSLVPRVTHDGDDGTHVTPGFQARSFSHVELDGSAQAELAALRVCDPLADLDIVPSAAARMYLNLCRHLWTLQAQSLAFKHLAPDFAGARARRFRLGSYEYLLLRRRA